VKQIVVTLELDHPGHTLIKKVNIISGKKMMAVFKGDFIQLVF